MFDRRFTLEITDRPAVLARIVTLCQQRCCEITALSYIAADRHRGAELELSVRASSWHGDRLAAWLASLVDVVRVEEAGAASPSRASGVSLRTASRPRRPASTWLLVPE